MLRWISSISQTIKHFSFINFSLWTSPTAELPLQCQTSWSSPTPMLQINLEKILCWGLYTITLQTFWFLCFHIRFVYYENLVSTLKQLGVKNDIIDYDGIKLEKQKQTLYGLIEAASLLLTSSGKYYCVKRNSSSFYFFPSKDSASLTKKSPVPSHPVKAKRIQSKILGDFSPRDSSSSLTNGHDDVNENIGDRIVELMERATVANTTRKVNSF